MKLKGIVIFFISVILFSVFFRSAPAQAVGEVWVYCFCSDSLAGITKENYQQKKTDTISNCLPVNIGKCLEGGGLMADGKHYDVCRPSDKELQCVDFQRAWEREKTTTIQAFEVNDVSTRTGILGVLIPECALMDELTPQCKDAGIFVILAIRVAQYLFSIIGALALLMFVYGGIMLVISSGNPERVKKGGEIIMSAVFGIVITFGAYVLIQFLGEALNLKPEYKIDESAANLKQQQQQADQALKKAGL